LEESKNMGKRVPVVRADGDCGETVEEIAEAALKKYDSDVHSRMTQQQNRRWFFIVAMW
jgi:hypothetical protein